MYDLLKALSCQRWSLPRMSHTQPWQNSRLRLVAKVSSQDTGSKHHVTAAVHTATARPTPAASPGTPYQRRGIPIQPGEVHLWWLDPSKIQSPRLLQQYRTNLTEPERDFVAQGGSESIRKERLLARTLVRTVLSRYCDGNITPKQLRFESNMTGKPYLVSGESYDPILGQLHFNLTHTSSLLGLAVARGVLVGLDVEDSTRRTKSSPTKLAKKKFSDREYAVLEGFENPREQANLFIRLWTLKEAYVKAQGLGISASPGLKSFTFELLLSNRVKRYEAQQPSVRLETLSSATVAQSVESSSPSLDNSDNDASMGGATASQDSQASSSGFSSGGHTSPAQSNAYSAFNLSSSTHSFPLTSEAGGTYPQESLSPWREPVSSSSEASSSSTYAWGTEHQTQAAPVERREETTSELQLPIFWSFRDRTPFRIQFQQSEDDSRRWAVWLMELQGGHTSALLMETDEKFHGEDNDRVEKQLRLRAFDTVPLQSEEVIHQSRFCRVIGFGMSA